MKTLIFGLTFFICYYPGIGQIKEPVFIDTVQKLLSSGICLENLHIEIPWNAEFTEVNNYGNPQIIHISHRTSTVRWDSVTILNGLKVSLGYSPYKIFLGGGKYTKLTTIYGSIDSLGFEKAKKYLETYTGMSGKTIDSKHRTSFQWVINNCGVRLGYWKERYRNRISSIYFLDFQHI